ncbi:uncharacterized protein NPIL_384761 [Nephila pilipes]|uniref:Mutator-like transposase domain-containing protein n=1 Tax=Nephila pilipes TaxID=299642 RepID=A0A8X6MP58_NEPPI|nr:uncharacterized protein NPIL_384761 [Nephila pilipes]
MEHGYTSMNGCVAALSIDTSKVVDIEMSSYCPTCRKLSKMPKGFISVKDTYGKDSVTKLECIGYVQKRVGARLRKLKSKNKSLSGKGKLTDSFIDRLQNYYGIAVRSNVGNLLKLQQNVIAALYHCASSGKKPMHGQCPIGKDSWCYYQRALSCGKKPKEKYNGLSNDILNLIKPTYLELCSKELLPKCLHEFVVSRGLPGSRFPCSQTTKQPRLQKFQNPPNFLKLFLPLRLCNLPKRHHNLPIRLQSKKKLNIQKKTSSAKANKTRPLATSKALQRQKLKLSSKNSVPRKKKNSSLTGMRWFYTHCPKIMTPWGSWRRDLPLPVRPFNGFCFLELPWFTTQTGGSQILSVLLFRKLF